MPLIEFKVKSPQKKSLFYLLKNILKEKRKLVFFALPLVLLIALGHSLYIFALGPFLKAFFYNGLSREMILLVELLPLKEGSFFYESLKDITLPGYALLFFLPALLFSSAFLKNLATYFYQVLINKLSFYFTRVYRESLFAGIISKEYRELIKNSPAKWMSIVMNDVFFLQERIILLMNHSVRDVVVLFSSIILLFVLYGSLGFFLCFVLVICFLFLSFFSRRIFTLTHAIQENLGFLANSLLEVRKRYYTIKTASAESLEIKKFTQVAGEFYSMALKSSSLKIIIPPVFECLGFIAVAFLLLQLKESGGGDEKNSFSFLMGFTILVTTIRPLKNIGEQIGLVYEIKGALKESSKHFSLLKFEVNQKRQEDIKQDFEFKQESICIESLICGFGDEAIIEIDSLTLTPGKSYFVFGPSGSGKSTLLKTLAGLIPAKKWHVDLSEEDFARQSHYVAQRSYTFDESVSDIILYGHPKKEEISKKRIWFALKSAELSKVVEKLPQKLNTKISSLKGSLSGGQLQRLLLSCVFLSDERILILDEASSHLDDSNNKLLIKNLLKEVRLKNKILITVHHDVKLRSFFDVSLRVEGGKLVRDQS